MKRNIDIVTSEGTLINALKVKYCWLNKTFKYYFTGELGIQKEITKEKAKQIIDNRKILVARV